MIVSTASKAKTEAGTCPQTIGFLPLSCQLGRHQLVVVSPKLCNPATLSQSFKCFLNIWEPVDHLQGSLGPSGPETLKKSESLPGPEPPRVWKKSRKSLSGPFRDFFQTRQTFSRLFPDSRGVPGPEARETFFRLFRGFGPGGPERPLKMVNGLPTQYFAPHLILAGLTLEMQDAVFLSARGLNAIAKKNKCNACLER